MPQSLTRSGVPCPFQSILLLTDDEANASADRNALRGAGVRQIHILASGVEAARYLAERVTSVLLPVTEAVVCLPQLEEMNAPQFAELIRTHPLLPHIPLLAVTGERGQEQTLLNSGFNAVLQRPFTTNALVGELQTQATRAKAARSALIATLRRDRAIPSHDKFDELLKKYIPPDKDLLSPVECLLYGKKALEEHRWKEALPYLNKAATSGDKQGEARLVLAALWREKGEPSKMKSCQIGALQAFVDAGSGKKIRVLAQRLAAEYPAPPSLLAREIERRIRLEQLEIIVDMLPYVRDLLSDIDLRQILLEGCQNTPSPEKSLTNLLTMLHSRGDSNAALADALEIETGRKRTQSKSWGLFGRKTPKQEKVSAKEASGTVDAERKKEIGIPLAELPEYYLDEEDLLAASSDASSLADTNSPRRDAKPSSKKTLPGADGGPAIPLLGEDADQDHPLPPSVLGDAWTMIRGTLRLYRSSR